MKLYYLPLFLISTVHTLPLSQWKHNIESFNKSKSIYIEILISKMCSVINEQTINGRREFLFSFNYGTSYSINLNYKEATGFIDELNTVGDTRTGLTPSRKILIDTFKNSTGCDAVAIHSRQPFILKISIS